MTLSQPGCLNAGATNSSLKQFSNFFPGVLVLAPGQHWFPVKAQYESWLQMKIRMRLTFMNRKRLLFVATRFPYPPVGGDKLRVYHMCRLLARDFDLELLTMGSARPDEVEAFRHETGVQRVSVIPHSTIARLKGAFFALLDGSPLQVGFYRNKKLKTLFEEAVANADFVILHLIRASWLWEGQARIPSMLDMCDAISSRFWQPVASSNVDRQPRSPADEAV